MCVCVVKTGKCIIIQNKQSDINHLSSGHKNFKTSHAIKFNAMYIDVSMLLKT